MPTAATAEIDPLNSDGVMMADKLRDAGVKTAYKNYMGVTHEFFGMEAVVANAKQAQDFAASDLKAGFDTK